MHASSTNDAPVDLPAPERPVKAIRNVDPLPALIQSTTLSRSFLVGNRRGDAGQIGDQIRGLAEPAGEPTATDYSEIARGLLTRSIEDPPAGPDH